MKKYVYVVVSNDKFEWILEMFDSFNELFCWSGMLSRNCLSQYIRKHMLYRKKNCRFERILVEGV